MEGVLLLDEEPRDFRHVLETEDVLQDDEQVAVRHHEGRGQHGVTPAVPHHPQYARPHEEDERQPADVRDAPRLRTTGATQEVRFGVLQRYNMTDDAAWGVWHMHHSNFLYMNGQRRFNGFPASSPLVILFGCSCNDFGTSLPIMPFSLHSFTVSCFLRKLLVRYVYLLNEAQPIYFSKLESNYLKNLSRLLGMKIQLQFQTQ